MPGVAITGTGPRTPVDSTSNAEWVESLGRALALECQTQGGASRLLIDREWVRRTKPIRYALGPMETALAPQSFPQCEAITPFDERETRIAVDCDRTPDRNRPAKRPGA
jgi:hypothetical protein